MMNGKNVGPSARPLEPNRNVSTLGMHPRAFRDITATKQSLFQETSKLELQKSTYYTMHFVASLSTSPQDLNFLFYDFVNYTRARLNDVNSFFELYVN